MNTILNIDIETDIKKMESNTVVEDPVVVVEEKEKKKRATVEHNGMELVIPILLINPNINNKEQLLESLDIVDPKIEFNGPEDLNKYKEDILKKSKMLNSFIKNFRSEVTQYPIFNQENIARILISGKKNKHKEIEELNKELDEKAAKADIYIILIDGTTVGISSKQSKDATKSNNSVYNYFDKESIKNLKKIKLDYLTEKGFPTFVKSERDKVNKLFYAQNKENPYWIELKDLLLLNQDKIKKEVTGFLFCSNVPYDIYEFNGDSFNKINAIIDQNMVTFEEHLPYYLGKTGKERNAAKLFYQLVVCEKKFRVEIRWKGNVYSAAPQFLLHEE
jgi:uncharacterized protein YhbP (UPF0306 family)